MKIVVKSKKEAKVVKKIFDSIHDALFDFPGCMEDFIDPQNGVEYAIMWRFVKVPIEIDKKEIAIRKQFEDEVTEYEEEMS